MWNRSGRPPRSLRPAARPPRDRVRVDHRGPVALVRVNGHDLDLGQPDVRHPGRSWRASRHSTMSRICPVPMSTTAITNRRRRRRRAGAITVSSKPTIAVGPTRSGSPTRTCPSERPRPVRVLTAHRGSGQDQTRFRHRTSTARSPTGASRRLTHRRSLGRARVPHPEQAV